MSEPVDKPELQTPATWLARLEPDTVIIDADGWRGDERSYDDPITRKEFYERLAMCTLAIQR